MQMKKYRQTFVAQENVNVSAILKCKLNLVWCQSFHGFTHERDPGVEECRGISLAVQEDHRLWRFCFFKKLET